MSWFTQNSGRGLATKQALWFKQAWLIFGFYDIKNEYAYFYAIWEIA